MIKSNQKIKIYICRNSMREYYESKAYPCKIGDTIEIEARDLSQGSHKKITYICDYCGKEFERVIYSNIRSKKNGIQKDACSDCQTKITKDNNFLKYGVDNPMKVPEIQLRCEQAKQNKNFENSKPFSCYRFVNGIPVSLAQDNLAKILDFEINFHYNQYYLDLVKNDIVIEYDGRGHDMEVRMNKISEQTFIEKEKIKEQKILENFRLLRIVDKKDKFKRKENIDKYLSQITDFIASDECYKVIEIK